MSVALTGGRQHHDLRRRAGLHEDSGLCRPEDGFRGRVLKEFSPAAEVPTDARLWHPWLRISRVLRVMLHTRWSAEAWAEVRVEFRKAPALRGEIRRAGWFNEAPCPA